MHIRDLPGDILHMVLKEAFVHCNDMRKLYSVNLPLAAVCQRWRCLALPVIHSCLYIEPESLEPIFGEAQGASDMPEVANLATNLDFIVSAGCTRSVKRVEIVLPVAENILPDMYRAALMMRAAAERWGGVKELRINARFVYRAPIPDAVDITKHDGNIARICTALASMMPGIRKLEFDVWPNPANQRFYWRLAGHYGDQLWNIRGRFLTDLPSGVTLKQLKRASIECGSMVGQQPCFIDPETLTALSLSDCLPGHSWAPFAADKNASIIKFPNLKSLDIRYPRRSAWGDSMEQHQSVVPWKLHFPKLEHLDVECMQGACPLFKHAVLPPHVDTISITPSVPALLEIADAPLPTAKHIDMTIKMSHDEHPAALDAARRIFERAKGASVLELTVFCGTLMVPPELISPLLTRLELYSPTNVDTMLGLIHRLPNLAVLGLWRLVLDDAQSNISVPEPCVDCQVEPFSTKINAMVLVATQAKQRPEILVALIKYMLLMVPSLKCIFADGIPKDAILEFIDMHLMSHPHMEDVILKIRGDDDDDEDS